METRKFKNKEIIFSHMKTTKSHSTFKCIWLLNMLFFPLGDFIVIYFNFISSIGIFFHDPQ